MGPRILPSMREKSRYVKFKVISEDFYNRLSDTLQKVTDAFITKTDQMSKKKEQDLTTI